MSTWDPYDEPEFEGIYELPVTNRPVMSPRLNSSHFAESRMPSSA